VKSRGDSLEVQGSNWLKTFKVLLPCSFVALTFIHVYRKCLEVVMYLWW
jgi:hypothetical protein